MLPKTVIRSGGEYKCRTVKMCYKVREQQLKKYYVCGTYYVPIIENRYPRKNEKEI